MYFMHNTMPEINHTDVCNKKLPKTSNNIDGILQRSHWKQKYKCFVFYGCFACYLTNFIILEYAVGILYNMFTWYTYMYLEGMRWNFTWNNYLDIGSCTVFLFLEVINDSPQNKLQENISGNG